MAYEVIESPGFGRAIMRAMDYLAVHLGSPAAARHLADELDKAVDLIGFNPYINAVSRKDSLERLGIREHLVMNYVILYSASDEGVVELLAFHHQTQDYETSFLM